MLAARPMMRRRPRTTRSGSRNVSWLRKLRLGTCVLLPLWAAACDGRLVVLGESTPRTYRFSEPRMLGELGPATKTDNPSLTADLLELYFTSERGASADVYVAERTDPDQPFGSPSRVATASTDGYETSPVVTADGLTLYWASDRPGGLGDLDVWLATRASRSAAWGTPHDVRALSSQAKDLPRPPGQRGAIMPVSSDREQRGYYAILFAHWSDATREFIEPEPVPELRFERASTVDAFLTDDGLTCFYVTGPAFGAADIYVASRRTTDAPFEHLTPLTGINSASDERDPWLSPDGSRFFFSSDRSGQYAIYEARVLPD